MRQSVLFTKTRKEAPKDEVSKNAKLLIRAGFIHKDLAGVYSFLPLGLRVLNKVINIIREEMNAIGGQEIFLTSLQDKEVWEKTGRFSDEAVDDWFKTNLKNGTEVGLAFTHEEPLTALMKNHIASYDDLPVYTYQFQTKFRNETRAKSGVLRCREFIMKDLYSFSRDEKSHKEFYEKAKNAYSTIFKRVGLGDSTYVTFASGGTFSKYSHEFQTICDAGEDIIFIDKKKKIAVNKEVYTDEALKDLGLSKGDLIEVKAIEVGNIFSLGTRFSDAFGLLYLDEKGEKKPLIMGSYGIGPARLMGTVVESYGDESGLLWPKEITPFTFHILAVGDVLSQAEKLYKDLTAAGKEVLLDDREVSAGVKFSDSDLLGISYRVVVSEKTIKEDRYELKKRGSEKHSLVSFEELLSI